jgi:hypothetical protein
VTSRFQRYGVELALVAVAAIWGGTFVMVKEAVARYPFYGFLGLRFAIGVAAFLLMFPKAVTRFRSGTLGVGLLAGAFMCAGYIFQTWGLQGTNASKAAFITGMFVVITPVLQFALLRRAPGLPALGGVAGEPGAEDVREGLGPAVGGVRARLVIGVAVVHDQDVRARARLRHDLVDRGQHGLFDAAELEHERVVALAQVLEEGEFFSNRAQLRQVLSCAEGTPGPGEHDGSHGRVPGGGSQRLQQGGDQL